MKTCKNKDCVENRESLDFLNGIFVAMLLSLVIGGLWYIGNSYLKESYKEAFHNGYSEGYSEAKDRARTAALGVNEECYDTIFKALK
jgi:hypothetical protein